MQLGQQLIQQARQQGQSFPDVNGDGIDDRLQDPNFLAQKTTQVHQQQPGLLGQLLGGGGASGGHASGAGGAAPAGGGTSGGTSGGMGGMLGSLLAKGIMGGIAGAGLMRMLGGGGLHYGGGLFGPPTWAATSAAIPCSVAAWGAWTRCTRKATKKAWRMPTGETSGNKAVARRAGRAC